MEQIFALKESEFLFFFDDSKFFTAFIETVTPNDIDEDFKEQYSRNVKLFIKSLKQNFINNYLIFKAGHRNNC